jgi:hypothetical protein
MKDITKPAAVGMRTRPLPLEQAVPSLSHDEGWYPPGEPEAVQLVTGPTCYYLTGALGFFGKKVIRYGCGNSLDLLGGSIVSIRGSFWTVQSVTFDPTLNTYHEGPRVPLAKAWFYVLHD